MTARRAFVHALFEGLQIIWPVLSVMLALIAGIGAVVGLIEGWGVWRGIYFGFVTALTIGYGDLAPSHPLTQFLAVLAGFTGIGMVAVLAGLSVRAFHATMERTRKD